MGGDPGEVERRECSKKVSAVDGAQTEGENEVVDDACPEIVGHAKVFRLHEREFLQAEQRVGGKDERPDLVEVGISQAEGLEHGGDVGRLGDGASVRNGRGGLNAARALPESSFGVYVGEERAGDLGEEAIDVV